MPHFKIELPATVLNNHSATDIMKNVYDTADRSGLFGNETINVRIQTYDHYDVGGTGSEFVHVSGYIMSGTASDEKNSLSKDMVSNLNQSLSSVSYVSSSVADMDIYNDQDSV